MPIIPNSSASLAKQMQQTVEYVAFKKAYQAGQWSVDFDKINKEIDAQHLRSKLRMLKATQLTKSTLDEANLQNAAHRSRLVEIAVQLHRINSTLYQRTVRVQEDLRATFGKELKVLYKTIAERTSAVDNLFKVANDHMANLELAISTIDMLIKDLDQSGFTLQRHVKLFIAANKGMDIG